MRDQRKTMRELFESKPNVKIPLYELMKIAAQYNARIHELRAEGMHIRNHIQIVRGERRTWYEYVKETI